MGWRSEPSGAVEILEQCSRMWRGDLNVLVLLRDWNSVAACGVESESSGAVEKSEYCGRMWHGVMSNARHPWVSKVLTDK
jgi:hypothetical protein